MPAISVVMSVYNGGAGLGRTVDSILGQTVKDFEFLIVDDGSTDDSRPYLEGVASHDSRVRLLSQENLGLTAALARACSMANGEFIARQDVGDISFPLRFERQLEFMRQRKDVVVVGGGYKRRGPMGEDLGDFCRDETPEEVTRALVERGVSLPHMAVMFRRDAYQKSGGYRTEFRYAQDIDLWYRLTDFGLLGSVKEVLFEMQIDLIGISACRRVEQAALAALAKQSFLLRRDGLTDHDVLLAAKALSEGRLLGVRSKSSRHAAAQRQYFIGSLLFDRRDARCRAYLLRAMTSPRVACKALWKYLSSLAAARSRRPFGRGGDA